MSACTRARSPGTQKACGSRHRRQPETSAASRQARRSGSSQGVSRHKDAKELLRLLIKDIRVHDRHTIIPTYRVPPAVRTMHGTVGDTGHSANRADGPEFEGWTLDVGA
jgi:hypothetical protein